MPNVWSGKELRNDCSRCLPDFLLELVVDHLVVGADCDGGEVDVPDGVVGAGHGGEGGIQLPLAVDRGNQQGGQGEAGQAKKEPEESGC